MEIIDLTQTIESGMEVYSGDPKVEITQVHFLEREGWRLKLLSFGSHTGTHVDAFSHMVEHGQTLDKLLLNRFIGRAKIVDIKYNLPKNVGLIFKEGLIDLRHVEKIITSGASFIAIGDKARFSDVEVERVLLKNRILTFTDLINLSLLPQDKEFTFYGIPLKIKDGDGSPIRAFAILD